MCNSGSDMSMNYKVTRHMLMGQEEIFKYRGGQENSKKGTFEQRPERSEGVKPGHYLG